MAAPTYIWEYVTNLFGLGPPSVVCLEATTDLMVKVGTLCVMASGQVDEATADVLLPIGLAAEVIDVAAVAKDPVKIYALRPGDVIKGTADADASALSGFSGKTMDLNTDGSLDVADTAGGCLSVYRTEDAGLTVFCVLSKLAAF